MKELILIRHGKSSWEYPVSDKDRPLLQRGINDGHLVANAFAEEALNIDAVFSSPANRALHTCMIVVRVLNYPLAQCTITDALYDFSGGSVMNFVLGLNEGLDKVMIFGHNHAFTEVANDWGNQAISNVPTSGLVHLKFNVERWAEITHGITANTIFPKHLK